eukprot:scaffold294802_cov23-Tisochrysis_lutea.AAC.1
MECEAPTSANSSAGKHTRGGWGGLMKRRETGERRDQNDGGELRERNAKWQKTAREVPLEREKFQRD